MVVENTITRLESLRSDPSPHGRPTEATVTIHGVELTMSCRNFWGDDQAVYRAMGAFCAQAITHGSPETCRDFERLRDFGHRAALGATEKWPCWDDAWRHELPEVEAVPTGGYVNMRYAKSQGGR